MIKLDYNNFSLSYYMGQRLRKEVERQLSDDIRHYGINNKILKYDWSESVIEGRRSKVFDSQINNFSDIKVFDSTDEIIAEGWIDFIHEEQYDLFIVYWDQLDLYENGRQKEVKKFGIPDYIYEKLPNGLKIKYKNEVTVIDFK
ncbi:hypothetical protein KPL26_08510 [Clostridium algidicarnis]|uniref:hypothetical protein n=1 Tax=Clostridium algidicarnis TaxID=37659 RepID=UPI001C0B3902|nr:hypothetical protein [Clostridium algidicarnis]MBU3196716.1 hypothetical protein [Clostridium algidicarnis]